MYSWLRQEINAIRTQKFHLIDDEIPLPARQFPFGDLDLLPPSYKCFVEMFGTARLYRELGYYLIRVSRIPWIVRGERTFVCFGGFDTCDAGFFEDALQHNVECEVYEGNELSTPPARVASSFSAWIEQRAIDAKKRYSSAEWAAIVSGPRPFSSRDLAILTARTLMRWRLIGISLDGNLEIEIRNESTLVLPYLSIGIRGLEHDLEGVIWLPVQHVVPGTSVVVVHAGYKDLVDNTKVELFQLPSPGPDDRERYWEFEAIPETP